jgi:hypothetical protein
MEFTEIQQAKISISVKCGFNMVVDINQGTSNEVHLYKKNYSEYIATVTYEVD